MIWKFGYRVFSWLASLELAVVLILILATALAAGTIYEAKFSALVASKMVYRSIWMQILLWLFVANVSAAAVSRIPWRRHHIGFLITHLGIITLLVGSFLTQRMGIDGSLALAPGEAGRKVQIEEDVLNIYRAMPEKNYELVTSRPVSLNPLLDFVGPQKLDASGVHLAIENFYPKARRIVAVNDITGRNGVPAIRFQLKSSRASFSDWLFLQDDVATSRDLGPARIRFQRGKPKLIKVDKPTLYLYLMPKSKQLYVGTVHPRDQKWRSLGAIKSGASLPLGWMDFSFSLDELHWSAAPSVSYQKVDSSVQAPGFSEAMEVSLNGERVWVELGSAAQVSAGNSLYYVQYTKKSVDIGFPLKLEKFKIGYYEGTSRPKSYSSLVSAGSIHQEISMNEPLKMNGFTFYQASYDMDQAGNPVASIFSVNYDPGRWIKYLGSLMIVLGILSMFYFKPIYSGKNKVLAKKPAKETIV